MSHRPAPPVRVLHVIADLEIGGGQMVVRTLVEYLARNGSRPVVCTFRDGPLRPPIEALGIPVLLLPPRRHSILWLPGFLADMRRIYRALLAVVRQYQIQVVQTHLLHILDFLTLGLKLRPPRPAVFWTFHSARFALRAEHLPRHRWLLRPKWAVQRQLYRLAARRCDGFIAVSEQIQEALLQTFGPALAPQITVIPNGVDTDRYGRPVDRAAIRTAAGIPAAARLLVMVGTLKPVKGHRYMLEALPALLAVDPTIHLALIGDGELRADLAAQATALGVRDHVHFLGNRDDVPTLLAAADLFVLPSLWEGLSMALLEAMATGLPIVASAVSGTVQAITPEVEGLLVPPGDVPALQAALAALLAEPERAQQLGAAAQRRAIREFSAQRQALRYLELYRRAIRESR